jgi:hypothetical protein
MSNRAIRGQCRLPKYLNSDNDPLYKFHEWQANPQILEVTEVKIVPYIPCLIPSWKGSSAPFDANIWITQCSGRLSIWKINCSISGTTTTTIAPFTHGKAQRHSRTIIGGPG